MQRLGSAVLAHDFYPAGESTHLDMPNVSSEPRVTARSAVARWLDWLVGLFFHLVWPMAIIAEIRL